MKDLQLITAKKRSWISIRGLRTAADFEFERAIAQINRVMERVSNPYSSDCS